MNLNTKKRLESAKIDIFLMPTIHTIIRGYSDQNHCHVTKNLTILYIISESLSN